MLATVLVALVPLLALSAWQAGERQHSDALNQARQREAAARLAASRFEAIVESSHRLLAAACSPEVAEAVLGGAPAAIDRCARDFSRLIETFPGQYESITMTDAGNVVRCSNDVGIVGMTYSGGELLQQVRQARRFVVGSPVASHPSGKPVLPAAVPLAGDGGLRGMCTLTLSLGVPEHLMPLQGDGDPQPDRVVLVDRNGASVAGGAVAAHSLPVPARLAAAAVGDQASFRDWGQDGSLHDFALASLAGGTLFVVVATPADEGPFASLDAWSGFIELFLAVTLVGGVIWLGAERWCMGPLRYIQDFAGRVARGEDLELAPKNAWGPELASVADGVKAMAGAIATREAELRAGLEQRDHMLREIHHRVKNNLQMISSLLNLQAGEIRSPRIRRFFGDAQNRVLTLSILHRHLYERSSWALVDFQQFISDLVRQISVGRRRGEAGQPRFHIRAPIMAVGPDVAIPIGLIVTEAVSSALSRNFGAVAAPEIRIEAGDKDGQVELVIEDNGSGSGGTIGPNVRTGFGVTLIRGLAMQLGGEAHIAAREGGGTRVSVTFPAPQEAEGDG